MLIFSTFKERDSIHVADKLVVTAISRFGIIDSRVTIQVSEKPV